MADIIYSYNKNERLYKYDETFSEKYYFQNEIDEKASHLFVLNKRYSRKIITTDTLKGVITINSLSENSFSDGIVINSCGLEIVLISIGTNIYYVAKCNKIESIKIELYIKSILYTFMSQHKCVIDVTRYSFYFDNQTINIPIYKKLKEK